MLGGACVIASPSLPWFQGVEHVPGHPGSFHQNGFARYSRQAWVGGGRALILVGAVCVVGGLIALARHPIVGCSLILIGGLAAVLIGVSDNGVVSSLTAVWLPGLDSYDVTMGFALGLPMLFIGGALALVGGLVIVVARLAQSASARRPASTPLAT